MNDSLASARFAPLPLADGPIYSCVRCSDRKIRCDKRRPCGACVRHDAQCVGRTPLPPLRKRKRVKDLSQKDRLKRYEALLKSHGVDPEEEPNHSQPEPLISEHVSENPTAGHEVQYPTPASTTTGTERSIVDAQLLQGEGTSRLLDK